MLNVIRLPYNMKRHSIPDSGKSFRLIFIESRDLFYYITENRANPSYVNLPIIDQEKNFFYSLNFIFFVKFCLKLDF
jgi:hypothetical protein